MINYDIVSLHFDKQNPGFKAVHYTVEMLVMSRLLVTHTIIIMEYEMSLAFETMLDCFCRCKLVG